MEGEGKGQGKRKEKQVQRSKDNVVSVRPSLHLLLVTEQFKNTLPLPVSTQRTRQLQNDNTVTGKSLPATHQYHRWRERRRVMGDVSVMHLLMNRRGYSDASAAHRRNDTGRLERTGPYDPSDVLHDRSTLVIIANPRGNLNHTLRIILEASPGLTVSRVDSEVEKCARMEDEERGINHRRGKIPKMRH
ncbi:hypothetical protein JOB18_004840 [Solea senegalensis]|uniref:Uncharacterized protein n=1 Tax=Solea senegalensis TaxID=28829 RepID=A0AAV6T399_SOLSE|nr:hypothetical protein JOB18_004840 [Solea senegalensis]